MRSARRLATVWSRLRHERLGEKTERAHRGLQLVAHVRDEVPADLFQSPALGDVVDDRDHPEGPPPVVDDLGADVEGAPRRTVEIEDSRSRPFAPRLGEKLLHRLRRQRIAVATAHHRVGTGVAEDVLAVLVADDDALGKRVERAAQPDGIRRRLLHRLGRTLDPLLDVAEGPLDAGRACRRCGSRSRAGTRERRGAAPDDRRPERRPSTFATIVANEPGGGHGDQGDDRARGTRRRSRGASGHSMTGGAGLRVTTVSTNRHEKY